MLNFILSVYFLLFFLETEQTLRANDNWHRQAKAHLGDRQLIKNIPEREFVGNLLEHWLVKNFGDPLISKLQADQLMNRKAVGFHSEYGANKKKGTKEKSGTRHLSENCKLYPGIIIVGFDKCGTITLRRYFGSHPEIFLTHIECNIPYFNPVIRISFGNFTKHMPCTPARKQKLEKISPDGSAVKVFETIPNVKLLAIVREPVERAMSQYVHNVAIRKENRTDFDAIITSSLDARANESAAVTMPDLFRYSTYITLLEPWLQTFGRDKIHVVDGDNFVKQPAFELNKIEKFLNISQYFTNDHFVYNPGKQFFCLKETGCMGRSKGRPHPNMTEITRKRLQAYFKPFNEKLFLALGQRFSWDY